MGIAVEQNTARLNIAKEVDIHKSISLLSNLYFGRVLSFGKFLSDVLVSDSRENLLSSIHPT